MVNDDMPPADECACGRHVLEGAHCRLCHENFDTIDEILNHLRLFHPDSWDEVKTAIDAMKDEMRKLRGND